MTTRVTRNEDAWFVEIYSNVFGEPTDTAGPFDDEHEAEMASRRILQQAGEL